MIPLTSKSNQRDRIHEEITSIRQWLTDCSIGELSSIEVFPTSATSKQSLVSSAIDELNSELNEIETRLDNYTKSVGMNAGSRMYSSGTQVDAVKAIQQKISVLKDAGLLELQIDLVQRRLEAITSNQSTALLDRVSELSDKIMADSTTILTERDAIDALYKDLQREEKRTDANLGSNAFDVLLLHSRVDLVLHKAQTMQRDAQREVELERSAKASLQPFDVSPNGASTVKVSKPKVVDTGKSGTTKSRKNKAI